MANRATRPLGLMLTLYVAALGATLGTGGARGQSSPATAEGDGWHLVRPGDRLEDLAARYLGDRQQWRVLWRLNPTVEDPDLLHPGSRVRVELESERAVPAARVEKVARSVETKPEPRAWLPASLGDYLIERDGVRTQAGSSAELQFSDGDRLRVGENSLVFLQLRAGRLRGGAARAVAGAAGASTPPGGVEIVAGQADLEMVPAAQRRAKVGVEVRVGGTRAAVEAPASDVGRARARSEAGGAQLMVFAGNASVESAGHKVEVPAGSGTSVPKGEAPRPPERLLPAPTLLAPADGAPQHLAAATFSWQPVDGATAYVVEVCADAECGQLVARADVTTGATQWAAPPLPAGRLVWRVSARSASGLDGFPAPARTFEAREMSDQRAPTGRIEISGRSVEAGGRKIWRSDAKLAVVVEDAARPGEPASGMGDWTLELDGRPTSHEWLRGPFPTGSYELAVTARDQAGNEGRIGPVTFQVDASAPTISWEVVMDPRVPRAGGASFPWDGRVSALEWKAVDPNWLVWRWSKPEEEMTALPIRWAAAGSPAGAGAARVEILLVADSAVNFGADVDARLYAGAALRLRFSDVGGDLARASISRDPGAGQGQAAAKATLLLEARDLLGNERRIVVPVAWP